MTTRAARVLGTLLAAGFAATAGGRALADEPPLDEVRDQAEKAFVVGRVGDLDGILADGASAGAVEPIFVRDGIWRPARSLPALPRDDGSLSSRRVRWIVDELRTGRASLDAYPLPRAGETDLYPKITALVLDRARREAIGTAGLPDASPLARVDDPLLQWIQKTYTVPTFGDAPRAAATPEDEQTRRLMLERTAETASRNRALALGSVGGLVIATLTLSVFLGRKRRGLRADL